MTLFYSILGSTLGWSWNVCLRATNVFIDEYQGVTFSPFKLFSLFPTISLINSSFLRTLQKSIGFYYILISGKAYKYIDCFKILLCTLTYIYVVYTF